MTTIRILHLSDAHFRQDRAWDSNPVLRSLTDAIGRDMANGLAPDLVVFSGDFAHAGKAEDFALAYEWLDRQLWPAMPADLPRDRLLLVPGNHDVDRSRIRRSARLLHDDLLKQGSQDVIAEILGDAHERQQLEDRLDGYLAFAARWYGIREAELFGRSAFNINGTKIDVACLNTAWLCQDDRDRGRLVLGRYQLNLALPESSEADWRIAIMHHPWDDLAEFDAYESRNLVHQHCDLVLRGHLHRTSAERILPPDPERGCVELAAGALYAGSQWPCAFQWIEMDRQQSEIRVHFRSWIDNAWTTDRNRPGAPEGVAVLKTAPATNQTSLNHTADVIVPAAYREHLQRCFGTLDTRGLVIEEGRSIRFRDVYVPALVQRRPETEGLHEAPSEFVTGIEDGKRENMAEPLLARLADRSLCVTAPAGAGKSIFCQWAVLHTVAGPLPPHPLPAPEELEEPATTELIGRLPLLVELRDFCDDMDWGKAGRKWHRDGLEQALGHWAGEHAAHGLNGALLTAHLANGTAFLIFDGFDEVPLTQERDGKTVYPRDILVAALKDALPIWNQAGNRILITSRPTQTGSDLAALDIEMTPLSGLPDEMQRLFARRWFHTLGKPELADALIDVVRSRTELRELTDNPLLLTALCVLYERGGELPQDRHQLYTDIVNNVLFNRYPGERGRRAPVLARLEAIALGMHTGHEVGEHRKNPAAAISQSEAERILAEFAKLNPTTESGRVEATEALDELLSRSGLLLPRDTMCQFYHLSIQEFLAAQRLTLTSDDIQAVFEKHGEVAQWRNTLMFLFAAQVLNRDGAQVDRVLGRLTSPHSRKSVKANPASAVLHAEMITAHLLRKAALSPGLADRFRQLCLDAIEDEIDIHARQALGICLGHLGDPRIKSLRDPKAFVEIAAGDYPLGNDKQPHPIEQAFHLSRFPVTNSQYREFLDDPQGAPDDRWWSPKGRKWRVEHQVAEPLFWRDRRWNAPNLPVVGVSYFEAEAFCKWAGGRLPTADESEAAARGPNGNTYAWGDDWNDSLGNTREAGLDQTSVVGLFPGSRQRDFDLHDMTGNVWEWSSTLHSKDVAVLRGGSWVSPQDFARCASRLNYVTDFRYFNVGFRVACSSPTFSDTGH